jgi:iron complex transport system ATP-binding protein
LKTDAIELTNVTLTRWGRTSLQGIDLVVETGTCCAILGPNGSGKSSLLAVLSGYLWPSTGSVTVDGQRYGRVNLAAVRRKIGSVEPSRAPKFDENMRLQEMVATGLFGTIMLPLNREVTDDQWPRVRAELASVGLGEIAKQMYGSLSSGEQMKALLARAMVSDPRLLLLDEPTVGLDMGSRAACVDVLSHLIERADPPTIVIVSHHLDELPRGVRKVVLMKDGRIAGDGTPDELLASGPLSDLFDCHVDVLNNDGRFIADVRPGGS